MAQNETRRMKPAQILTNVNSFSALQQLTDYKPVKTGMATKDGQLLLDTMNKSRAAEAQAEAALKTARDEANTAEWAFHNYMLGVKDQVTAQYGNSSNELQSLGLKKKSEYKRPVSKKAAK